MATTKKTATNTVAAKKTAPKKSAEKKSAATKSGGSGFSAAERSAMKAHAEELRRSGRGGDKKAADLEALLEKIGEMGASDRELAERVHAIAAEVAPGLDPKTWYGMPAYAKDGKVVFFFKPAEKFGSRYATLGFSDTAQLDEGTFWPTEFAVLAPTKETLDAITTLITRAVG